MTGNGAKGEERGWEVQKGEVEGRESSPPL